MDATVRAPVAQAFQRAPFEHINHACGICGGVFPGTEILDHGRACVAAHPDHPAVVAAREEQP